MALLTFDEQERRTKNFTKHAEKNAVSIPSSQTACNTEGITTKQPGRQCRPWFFRWQSFLQSIVHREWQWLHVRDDCRPATFPCTSDLPTVHHTTTHTHEHTWWSEKKLPSTLPNYKQCPKSYRQGWSFSLYSHVQEYYNVGFKYSMYDAICDTQTGII